MSTPLTAKREGQTTRHTCARTVRRTTAPLACLPRLTADVHMEGEKNRASRTLRGAPRHEFSYIMSLRACVCACERESVCHTMSLVTTGLCEQSGVCSTHNDATKALKKWSINVHTGQLITCVSMTVFFLQNKSTIFWNANKLQVRFAGAFVNLSKTFFFLFRKKWKHWTSNEKSAFWCCLP